MAEFDHVERVVLVLANAGSGTVYASVSTTFYPRLLLHRHRDKFERTQRFDTHIKPLLDPLNQDHGVRISRRVATVPVTHAEAIHDLNTLRGTDPRHVVYLLFEHIHESQDVFSLKYPNYVRISKTLWMKLEWLEHKKRWLLDAELHEHLSAPVKKGTLFFVRP